MRISTSMQYDTHLKHLQTTNTQLNESSQRYNTGLRFTQSGEDPSAMSAKVKYAGDIAAYKQYATNAGYATECLSEEETALDAMWTVLSSVQTRIQQAVNGSQDQNSLDALAEDIEQSKLQLFDLMNTRSAEGEYIFSGANSSVPTYSLSSDGHYICQADGATREVQVSPTVKVQTSDSGLDIFEHAELAHTMEEYTTTVALSSDNAGVGVSIADNAALQGLLLKNELGASDLKVVFNYDASSATPYTYTLTDADGNAIDGCEDIAYDGTASEFTITDADGNAMIDVTLDSSVAPIQTATTVSLTETETETEISTYISNYGDFDDLFTKYYDPAVGTAQYLTLAYTAPKYAHEVGTYSLIDFEGNVVGSGEATKDGMIEVKGMHFSLADTSASQNIAVTLEQPLKDNILNQLNIVIEKLRGASDLSSDEFYQLMQDGQRAVANAKNHYDMYRGRVGARESNIDRVIVSDQMLQDIKTEAKANITEVDAFEAVSEMVQDQTALQAAQQSYQMVHKTTLFDYI